MFTNLFKSIRIGYTTITKLAIFKQSSFYQNGKQPSSSKCFDTITRCMSLHRIPQNVIHEALSESSREQVVKKLEELRKRKLSFCTEEASVLIPLCIVDDKPSILFTLRSNALNSHRGQVSFPGGKRENKDKNSVETALRETLEELHIPQDRIDVWGSLPEMPDRKGKIAVTTVVSCLGKVDISSIQFNQNEVSEVFHLTFEHILANRRYTAFTTGSIMPVFINGPHRVWGMTAIMVDYFFEILFPGQYKKLFAHTDRGKVPWVSKAIKENEQ